MIPTKEERIEEDRLRHISERVVRERADSYKEVFSGRTTNSLTVLEDLSRFCREKESCFNNDPRVHALAEGRREVILRIRKYVETPAEDLISSLLN